MKLSDYMRRIHLMCGYSHAVTTSNEQLSKMSTKDIKAMQKLVGDVEKNYPIEVMYAQNPATAVAARSFWVGANSILEVLQMTGGDMDMEIDETRVFGNIETLNMGKATVDKIISDMNDNQRTN